MVSNQISIVCMMYCFQGILLYIICCFATGTETYGILQDTVNENDIDSQDVKQSINLGNYVETKLEQNEGIFYHQELMGKTVEESMKLIVMLEDKLRAYDKDSIRINLLEDKLLAAEEVANKQSYRVQMLEKRLQKSEHGRLVQVQALQRKLKDADRRLLQVNMFENRLRAAEDRLANVKMFELRLKQFEQLLSESKSEFGWQPRTKQSMKNTVAPKNGNLTEGLNVFGTTPTNYIEKGKSGHPLPEDNISSDYISTARRDKRYAQHLRIGFSAEQNQHGESVHLGQTIIFHKVHFNEDGAFDKLTGNYRCPVSGAYFFTLTVCSVNGNRVAASLVLNGQEKFDVFAGVGNDNNGLHDSLGTGTAILQCHAGDLVWARIFDGAYIGHLTFITGFLLWDDSQSS